jgi:hypothetical protein
MKDRIDRKTWPGMVFGPFTLLERLTKTRNPKWRVRCRCGRDRIVRQSLFSKQRRGCAFCWQEGTGEP